MCSQQVNSKIKEIFKFLKNLFFNLKLLLINKKLSIYIKGKEIFPSKKKKKNNNSSSLIRFYFLNFIFSINFREREIERGKRGEKKYNNNKTNINIIGKKKKKQEEIQ